MASFEIAADEVGAYDEKLSANTVDSVVFHAELDEVELISDGAAAIYFTVDGSTPTVGGKNCLHLPASPSVRVVSTPAPPNTRTTTRTTTVKLISPGTPNYSVARVV
jgi:hypothetical protein